MTREEFTLCVQILGWQNESKSNHPYAFTKDSCTIYYAEHGNKDNITFYPHPFGGGDSGRKKFKTHERLLDFITTIPDEPDAE